MPCRNTGTSSMATVPAVTGIAGLAVCAAACGTSAPERCHQTAAAATIATTTAAPITRLTMPQRLLTRVPIKSTLFIIDILYESLISSFPAHQWRGALPAGGRLDRRAIRAPRHQTIFQLRLLPELANKPHSGNRQRQDDYQADQRRRPPLVGFIIAILGSVVHPFARDVMTVR